LFFPKRELKDKAFDFWERIKQKFVCPDNIEETECWLGDVGFPGNNDLKERKALPQLK